MKPSIHSGTARRVTTALVTAAIMTATLVGCSSTASGDSGSGSAAGSAAVDAALAKGGTITYWSWTPAAEAQVAAFEKAYPKVTVKLVNAGTGNDQYTKLQNAIKAGSGAPDVAQIEYSALPQFALGKSLVDLTDYGFDSLKADYATGPWGDVDFGGGVWGLPQDSGPMALFYNKKVFDTYGIQVPTTWDEYVADAKTLHTANPDAYIAADTGDAGQTTSMIWQAGGHPFTIDGDKVTVNLQDEGAKKYTAMWNQLVENKLVAPTPGWTDDWYKSLNDGSIATLISGAWMPGILESSVKDGAGNWRVAPIPTYDGKPANAESGGGGQSVLKQSKDPALAAGFVRWLNHDEDSVSIFVKAGGGFPTTTADLSSQEFLDAAPDYFGGQKINEVLADGAKSVLPGFTLLPFQLYANSIFSDTVGKSYESNSDINAGLQTWQQQIVDYGNKQGFTVTSK
jgi:multiple sugar transport system substrate-binding protein